MASLGHAVPTIEQIHHNFGSRFLHKQRFCCSYETIKQSEQSAHVTQGTEISLNEDSKQFIQFVADNVGSNLIATFMAWGWLHVPPLENRYDRVVPRVCV